MTEDDDSGGEGARIDPRYPFAQLMKALSSGGERARQRVQQWQDVLAGHFSGTLRIGTRAPVVELPPWVTLEVIHGGFATGKPLAGGPLLPHEEEMLAVVGGASGRAARSVLNLHFLGDAGRRQLDRMLVTGQFRIRVPEEGALLVVAWLLREGETDRAALLIEAILPFFDRLRFYPVPHPRALRAGLGVSMQTAGEVVLALKRQRPKLPVEKMNESLRLWAPLYDRAVALFLETVEGDAPAFARDEAGELDRAANGQPVVVGGWPCRRYSPEWPGHANALLTEYREARALQSHCGKPEKPKENFARLRGYLERCASDPKSLSGRDVGMIRKILASCAHRRGAPGSYRHQSMRAAQARVAAAPTYTPIANALAERLTPYPDDEGVEELDTLFLADSADASPLIDGVASIPPALLRKILRCLEAPLHVLTQKGLVPSAEAMAGLVPPLTAKARANPIADPDLRRVYQAIYVAFRRRRSLLLLNLASQVKLDELPWVAALRPWTGTDDVSREAARTPLGEVALLAIGTFPHTIIPNKLVKELRALAAGAGLPIPLVDELATDIFMGEFSETFLRAAKAAGRLLAGSLYERYYGLPYARVLALEDVVKKNETPVSPGFAALCAELAGPEGAAPFTARNGTIIEQAQILTTHNLAALSSNLGLTGSLDLPVLARRNYAWILRSWQKPSADWHSQLLTMKNTAHAFRQMVFFLALLDVTELGAFATWSALEFEKYDAPFRSRCAPAVMGLHAALAGEPFDANGRHPASGGRRFLGYTTSHHWLLSPRPNAERI